jgi:molecular chaperone GrpE
MAKENGKSETRSALDLEHELSAGEAVADPEAVGAPSENAANETELQKMKAERDSLLERLARMQAEFENARRRATREQQEFREFATADAVKAMLPVVDNFERALRAKSNAAEFRDGVKLIYKQLRDVFAKLGVQSIAAEGEAFDPRLHEAVEMVETEDAPDQTVVEELQSGYRMKERLLRPSMVRVAKNPGK